MTGTYEAVAALITEIDSVLADNQGAATITPVRMRQLTEDLVASLAPAETTLTYAAALTWTVDTNPVATVTLTGNLALTLAGGVNGQTYRLAIRQDGTGSRTVSLAGCTVLGSPTWATAANGINILTVEMSAGTRYVAVA